MLQYEKIPDSKTRIYQAVKRMAGLDVLQLYV